ncbi:MAG TPA: hypothetical protein DCX54_01235 [Flavobacteriales bacterium]|nr:hypothetical protein [Flavobacteriales bacterium]
MAPSLRKKYRRIKSRPSPKIIARIDTLLENALTIRVKDVDMSIHYASDALMMAKNIKDKERIARAKNYLGLFYMITCNNPQALYFAEKAKAYYSRKPNTAGEAFALYTIGSVNYKTANHEKGLDILFESLKIWREIGDKHNESKTLKAIGYIFEIFDDYDNAIKNYTRCLELSREIGDKNGESNACNPLSGIYLKQGNLKKADELIELSIKLKEETGDLRGIAFAYYGKGKVLFEQRKYIEAEEYYLKSLHLHFEMGEPMGEGLVKRKLGQVYLARGFMEKAELYTKMALEIGEKIENLDITYEAYFQLYTIAKMRGDIELSLEYFEKFHSVREKVLGMETSGKIKAREAIHSSELSGKQAEIERLKNVELKKAHDEIEHKNHEITQSIRYAQRIQQAILPSAQRWRTEFPESFTLFLPRDMVSGDFFWMKKKGNKVLFSAIDCTGHGVPGAMVSMVGYNGLNQLVERLNVTKPSVVLDNLCRFVKLAFKSEDLDIHDGMDMALCCFNKKNFTLEYAGANNPLYLVRDVELIEYKADKQQIGNYSDMNLFTNHVIQLKPGDRIYLMTDGYADQFGGPKHKKFKSSALKNLLLNIQTQNMHKQCDVLFKNFHDWRGLHFQVDDVCVLGVEF